MSPKVTPGLDATRPAEPVRLARRLPSPATVHGSCTRVRPVGQAAGGYRIVFCLHELEANHAPPAMARGSAARVLAATLFAHDPATLGVHVSAWLGVDGWAAWARRCGSGDVVY